MRLEMILRERARVEAAYDAVLMARLRDRQDGQVSQAAVNASAREQVKGVESPAASVPGVGVLQRFRSNLPDPSQSLSGLAPEWSLVEDRASSFAWLPARWRSFFCCSVQQQQPVGPLPRCDWRLPQSRSSRSSSVAGPWAGR